MSQQAINQQRLQRARLAAQQMEAASAEALTLLKLSTQAELAHDRVLARDITAATLRSAVEVAEYLVQRLAVIDHLLKE